MPCHPWESRKWPEKVPQEVTGFEIVLHCLMDDAAREFPHATYTIFADFPRTHGQVGDTAGRIESFLLSRGIQKGDRVAGILFGILKAGRVCVVCNQLYKPSEFNCQLMDPGSGDLQLDLRGIRLNKPFPLLI